MVFDDFFSTVPYMAKGEVPPHWASLVETLQEKVTEEDYDLAKTWLFPDAEVGDITMQDTNKNTTTQTPDAASGSTLVCSSVSFESQPLLNSGNFESMTNTAEISHRNDSIPRPFLNLIIPSALLASDAVSVPPLMNLELSGLR